ncbi:ABC transporter ATP-binding protein [Pseudoflavonifractor phocaeensis]|uniref:ABC transporter ATP-binding protein n=1 Tax=Pseudoflavonifractor phocaeensis TaxID=1870988 RepID=UPI00195A1FED|nr:ABC transporter ATP-binding protein [Pseudoflavonifractor phocaeensis]MBM6927201.1 ABC transporter ATP-binding protein [Pseudoflavonifractor phocaeensis]
MSVVKEQDHQNNQAGQTAMKRLSKPIKVWVTIAQVLTIFSALLAFVPYLALVWLGDIFLSVQMAGEQLRAEQVHEVVELLIMAFLSRLFFHALSLIITHFADMKLRFVIRQQIVSRLSRVPLAWFSQTDSGKIRNAVQDDTKTVHTVVAHAPVDVLNGVLSPLVLLVFMFVVNWRLALVGVATIPLYFFLQGLSMKDMGPKTAEMNRHLAKVSSSMIELVAGIKVVKAFGKTGEAHQNYQEATKDFSQAYWEWCAPLIGLCSVAGELISVPLLLLINLGGGALLFVAGFASLPQVLACTLIAIVLPVAISSVANTTWSYQMAGAAAVRLCNIMDIPVIPETNSPKQPNGLTVQVQNVTYSYGDTRALNDVTLTLKPNTITALIGPSGSGKSTLATLIARFDDPQSGSICLGGVDLRDISSQTLYNNIAFVLQDPMLMNASIRRNISLAKPDATMDDVRRAAKVAQIDDYIMSLPKGYDSVLGTDCLLSGGESQRISIARAILADAPILIMDEATAFADPDSELEIQKALSTLIQNRTVLVIAHRLNAILGADQIAVMENGNIVAVGTHQELLHHPHYQALLRQGGFPDDKEGEENHE